MSRQLPSQPNLRHLKNEAKEFRKALGRGDAGIAERLAANLPRLSDATSDQIQAAEVSLQEVQHVLAKEYGFTNWTELAASAEPPALPAGLEAVGRPLEQLSNDSVRQICHGISRIVKAYGESVASIGPGDFYRELEAVGGRASANISEVLNLAADGIEPAKIRHLMHNRTDNVMRNLEIRLRVVLEGVTAIRSQEHPRLIGHRLDTVCYSGYAIQYRGPEGTVEHFRDRMAERPAFHLRNDELAMAIVDLAWIAQQAGVAALQEVVDVIDDEHFRVGVQLVVDQVDAAELEGRIAPALERVRVPFTLLGEGLAAALEPRSVTACQPSRPAVGGHVRRHLRVPGRRDPRARHSRRRATAQLTGYLGGHGRQHLDRRREKLGAPGGGWIPRGRDSDVEPGPGPGRCPRRRPVARDAGPGCSAHRRRRVDDEVHDAERTPEQPDNGPSRRPGGRRVGRHRL